MSWDFLQGRRVIHGAEHDTTALDLLMDHLVDPG